MRNIKQACSTVFMITVASLVSPAVRGAGEAEQALPVEGVSESSAAEDEQVDDTAGSAGEEEPVAEEAPAEEPPAAEAAADEPEPAAEEIGSSPSRVTEPAPRSAPLLALAAPPAPVAAPPPPVVSEDPAAFRRRIAEARKLAAQQRKSMVIEAVPEGLSPTELEIRAAERNIAIYDKQIETGQGTHAIEAFRRLALDTVARLRRAQFVKVWGDALDQAEAPGILRQHAQRMAELKRVRFLADVKNYSGLVHRTDELIAKENACFEKSMQELREAQAKANAAANVAQATVVQP
jgi:hypothetical protein